MKKITATTLIILCVILFINCEQNQKSILLSYKYVPDTKISYEQILNRTVVVTENDSIIKEYTTKVTGNVVQEISDILDDGSATINETDTWYFETPCKDDSTKVEKKEITRELQLKVHPNGKIYDIIFADEADIATKEYIKSIYEQGMPEFPSNKISPGESWTQSTKVVLTDSTIMEPSTTYKFRGYQKENGYNCAVIDCEGILIIPLIQDPKDTTLRSGIDSITTTSTIYFAYKEGITVLQKEHWIINGKRNKLSDGKMIEYFVRVDTDSEYRLTEYETPE